MDENLDNDRLDEFVNRSFEHYSEDPSDSVWDAIENRMEVPVSPATITWTSHIWKYAAIIAILLLSGALINQHYSHKKQLVELEAEIINITTKSTENLNNTDIEHPIAKTYQEADQETNTNQNLGSNVAPDSKVSTQYGTVKNPGTKEVATTSDISKTNKEKANENILENKKRNNNSNLIVETPSSSNVADEKDVILKESKSEFVGQENSTVTTEVAEIATLQQAQTLDSEVFKKDAVSSLVAALPIPSKMFVPNLYASIMAAPTLTYEIRNNQQNFDPKHHDQVNNEQVGAVYSTDLNLRLGANLSNNWGIESGLVYSHMNRVAVHKPQFKFKDHKHGSGGPGGPPPPDNNHYFDFDYGLNTFGGSANLEIRVENVDTTYMFKDDDPINLNITTNEKLEILRVPLVGVYKVPMGRFGLVLKGGFIGNFLLKNELQITGLNTNDVKLKDREDNHHKRPPIESPSKFQLGYLFSTGACYKLTKHISFSAEPYISGNLSTTNCNGFKLPSYYSIGINTGITYNF